MDSKSLNITLDICEVFRKNYYNYPNYEKLLHSIIKFRNGKGFIIKNHKVVFYSKKKLSNPEKIFITNLKNKYEGQLCTAKQRLEIVTILTNRLKLLNIGNELVQQLISYFNLFKLAPINIYKKFMLNDKQVLVLDLSKYSNIASNLFIKKIK